MGLRDRLTRRTRRSRKKTTSLVKAVGKTTHHIPGATPPTVPFPEPPPFEGPADRR